MDYGYEYMARLCTMKNEYYEYFLLYHCLYAYCVWLTDVAGTWKSQSKILWVKWTLKELLWKKIGCCKEIMVYDSYDPM